MLPYRQSQQPSKVWPGVMPDVEDIVVVGRLGSPYGIQGWLHLQSFTTPAKNLLTYQPWFIQAPHSSVWRSLPQPQCRQHKKGFVTKLEGIADRDMAANVTGSLVGVSPDAFPAPEVSNEYYWRDLVGCAVVNEHGLKLGEVDHLLETGAHDVLVIKRAGLPAEHKDKDKDDLADEHLLIPFAAEYVTEVNVAAGTVTVNWDPDW